MPVLGRSPEAPPGRRHFPATGERLHPDLNHAVPKGPHWDYTDKGKRVWRYYPDGTLERK
jgi:hypothetical protein